MRVIFYGDYAIDNVRLIYEAAGWKCDVYKATEGRALGKLRELFKLLSADTVYIVSGCDVSQTFAYRLALALGKKLIVHWIGSDVLRIRESYEENPREINARCVNLAVSPWLVEELAAVGIKAAELPIVPPDLAGDVPPMPEGHAVLAYIPKHRAAFYHEELVTALARALPETPFHIVANDGENSPDRAPNMIYEGYLDRAQMNVLMKNCTVLFRYPVHDGLPRMMLEALAAGRAVVYNYPYPYTNTPKSEAREDILAELKRVLAQKPCVNEEAASFIREQFSLERMLDRYRDAGLLETNKAYREAQP